MNPLNSVNTVLENASRPIASLGFRPAFMDFATCTIYTDGDAPHGKSTLIPGYERNGFFYTRTAAVRAAREWVRD